MQIQKKSGGLCMRKLFTITILSIIWFLGVGVIQAEDPKEGDFTYKLEGDYAIITGYAGMASDLTIPANVGGYSVKKIAEAAFFNNTTIRNVVLEEGITELEMEAFSGTSLETIQLPDSLTLIGIGAFADTNLKKVELPQAMQRVGQQAFDNCKQLEEIKVKKPYMSSFYDLNGVLYNGPYLLKYPSKKQGETYIISNGTLSIGEIQDVAYLREVIVPSTVEDIYPNAFVHSDNILTIILQHTDNVEISPQAFNNLASGSKIVCKNEQIRAQAEKAIKGIGVTAVIDQKASTGINLQSPTTLTINPNETYQLQWNLEPYNTTDCITWNSSDETGLSVEKYNGLITARKRGSYVITGTNDSGHQVQIKVTVPTVVVDPLVNVRVFSTNQIVTECKAFNDYLLYSDRNPYMQNGIIRDFDECESFRYEWSCSKVAYIEVKNNHYSINFTPYESGKQMIFLKVYDKNNVLIGYGSQEINVTLDPNDIKDVKKLRYYVWQSYDYTGKSITPEVTLYNENGEAIYNGYYNVTYKNNVNVGTATIIVTGKYMLQGTIEIPFQIFPVNEPPIEKKPQSITATASYTKTVGDKAFSLNARSNGNGKLIYASNRSSVATVSSKGTVTLKGAGTATITITASETATYKKATKKITIMVNAKNIVTALKLKSHTTNKIAITWKKLSVSGYEIYRSTKKSSGYKKIKKIGNTTTFTDSKLKAGQTYYYKVRAYKNKNGKPVYEKFSSILTTTTKPAAASLKVTAGKKKAMITYKKVSGATGYEIYRSTKSNGKYSKIKTFKKSNQIKYTDSKLKARQTYYYKIRAYKKVSGKMVYSAYTKAMKIKIK